MSTLTYEEIQALPKEELRRLKDSPVSLAKDGAALYGQRIHAAQLWEQKYGAEDREQAKRAKEQKTRKMQEDRRTERIEAGDVLLPGWWITSGAWASLNHSAAKVAVAVTALLSKNGEHIPLEEIQETSGVSERTVYRALEECIRVGLLHKHTKPVPGANPPRRVCFFSIPATRCHG